MRVAIVRKVQTEAQRESEDLKSGVVDGRSGKLLVRMEAEKLKTTVLRTDQGSEYTFPAQAKMKAEQ